MKQLEKREKENLLRIFYTIIQIHQSSLLLYPLYFCYGEQRKFGLTIKLTQSLESIFPVYEVCIIEGWNHLLVETLMSVNLAGNYYEVLKFKSMGGLKELRMVLNAILNSKNEAGRIKN